MGNVIANPGSGPVEVGTWEQAYENIKQYIKDCEVPLRIVSSDFTPDDGRYLFTLCADEFQFRIEVEMPGLPLDKVRYMSEGEQNPFDFPRLYVDGSSWLWKFGLVTKEWVMECVEDKIGELQEEIKTLQSKIDEMKEEK